MTIDPQWTVTYQRVLGEELRQVRRMRGWTRRQLHTKLYSRFGLDASLQTLATYELGTRSIPHVRLVQIVITLGANLSELLDRVIERVFVDDARASGWDVDLDAASELDDPRLLPLRGWARCRLRDNNETPVPGTTEPMIVRLGLPELGDLAVLCGMDTLDLARHLPRPASRGKSCPPLLTPDGVPDMAVAVSP